MEIIDHVDGVIHRFLLEIQKEDRSAEVIEDESTSDSDSMQTISETDSISDFE